MTIKKQFISLIPLCIIVIGLVGYNFMGAQWAGPQATAPGSNTSAPINESASTQSKAGNFNAYILSAATSTWSPAYCDELGNNCFDPAQVVASRVCPTGKFVRGINPDGTLVCATATTTTATTCSPSNYTASTCNTSPPGSISCSSGYTKVGGVTYTGISCSTNGIRYTQQCMKLVCS